MKENATIEIDLRGDGVNELKNLYFKRVKVPPRDGSRWKVIVYQGR